MPTDPDVIPAYGYADAAHQRPKPKPKPKLGPPRKPTVTRYTPSGGGRGGGYDLSGFTAGAISQAEQQAMNFASWLGYPSWFDINAMAKKILQLKLNKDDTKAYEFLWTQLGHDRQKGNENAYFGLTQQQYTEKLNNLADMYHVYTGDTSVPTALRNQALRENWTQSELMTHLQADPTVGATAPWLAGGMTFRDVASQFGQQFGNAPADKPTLSSWWKFRTGAQAVTGGAEARQTYMPPQPLVARPLGSDVEVR